MQMNKKDLNKEIKKQAIALGLCEQWQKRWKDGWGREDLISRFKEGLDFCIEHNWPDKEFAKRNFPQELLRKNAVLIDDTYSLLNERVCVLMGSSKSNVRYNGHSSGTVFARHDSSVFVVAKTMSFCIVHLYDNASAECESYDNAMILIIRHGEKTSIGNTKGYIKIKDEF